MNGTLNFFRALNAVEDAAAGEKALTETDMTLAWLCFWVVLTGLSIFDIFCLAPKSTEGIEEQSSRKAFAHVAFWFATGLIFNAAVFIAYGKLAAIVWFDGYILEYLLSVDNVFFFHVVFQAYSTPASQVYKALFLGILIAVVLRSLFYIVGAGVFRLSFFVQIFFGLVLIYTGFKTAVSDEDDDDPRENRCVQFITRCLPLSDAYDENGALFARVPKNASKPSSDGAELPDVIGAASGEAAGDDGSALEMASPPGSPGLEIAAAPGSPGNGSSGETAMRGTMLFLVVVVLGVVDLIFAVDSVTAKIAEHDSTFINFSSSAFAMLCLRSMYFVLTLLLKFFRFLKYGVAAILVMIGIKLIASKWVEVPSIYSLAAICGIFIFSMVVSIVFPEGEHHELEEHDDPSSARKARTEILDDDLPMPDEDDFDVGI